MKIKNNRLGIVLEVISMELRDNELVLIVNHNKTNAKIPSDDINEDVSKAFVYIVKEFIKSNNIDFYPTGNFESDDTHDLWSFKIYGKKIEPIDYFINTLEENKK